MRRTKAAKTVEAMGSSFRAFANHVKGSHPGRRRWTVAHLNRAEIERFDAALQALGRSVRTRRARVRHIESLWRYAYDHPEYGHQIDRPPIGGMDMPSPQDMPVRAPTWAEMDEMLAVAEEHARPWQYHALVMQRYTGLRVSQVMRLRWDDFDLAQAMLTIRGELGKTGKEKRGRIVPVPVHLVAFLARLGRREGYVAGPHKAQRKLYPDDVRRLWERTGCAPELYLGRPGSNGQPTHALRRGYQSGLRRLGADFNAVEHLVGHDQPGVSGSYLDASWSLPLREAVAMVPEIGSTVEKVTRLAPKNAGRITVGSGTNGGRR